MAQYIKITSNVAGSRNNGLKSSITYIGKHYGKLANKEGYDSSEYFKHGRNYIAKRFGAFNKTAIFRMVEPKRIKGTSKAKQWCYNKRLYGKAYGYVVDLLLKAPIEDKEYIEALLNRLYTEICEKSGDNGELERICSNALIYWQKSMLSTETIDSSVSYDDRKEAGKILKAIAVVDKPLP